jgi:hypothetical protein
LVAHAQKILVGKPSEKKHLENVGVDGKIMLKQILKKVDVSVDWIQLDPDRVQRGRTHAKTAVYLRVP